MGRRVHTTLKRQPSRNGVGASCVVLPLAASDGEHVWRTITDFLVHRFPAIARATWLQRMHDGLVVDEDGVIVDANRPYQSQLRVYYYRDLPHEPRIPFDEVILFQDEHLIVVDKPHFLPVMPSGKYLQETVLVRLKRKLGLHDLVPIHRIDRDTAGLVLFSIQPATRDAYQALFRNRLVEKTYEAIAPWRSDLTFPITRESRIVEAGHFMLQQEVSGAPNAKTHIECLEVRGHLARYRLSPVTGKRHQLRVHMAALGLPIVGDGLYPQLTPEGADHQAVPLQLLAHRLSFTDPLTQRVSQFTSQRVLVW